MKLEKLTVLENESGEVLFECAEDAWFWYCKYEKRNPYKSNNSNKVIVRPCMLDDIYLSVVKLYLAKKISERHLKTLIKYGRLQCPPDSRIKDEEMEALWWDDAIDKLETVLRKKGIVRCEDLV
ncbi:hypothetical protein HDR60_01345 [bacterium]|nr:hypothetical protein [bacterium]